ncbi:conjugal transfer protein TrbE [Ralstonia pickettii]|jgi:type IV secretion/conjugal transfer VirB4 family ATPase|uniref:VirB4 family type IV secretion/conjugal transfer ATPase n=1 Tax=Ralstonia pickettii TaxID=329 RepID=UPI000BC9F84C|nr:conjugal transfer protein TrbE [Ralstonia pickettii]MBT2180959.1 conjugal transfer protein TrbE [Ralstonia pickettii]POH90099.1 conjugal transfer protein TrbE [Ralstonia pickettii]
MIEGLALLIGLAGAVLVTVLWWTVFKAAAPFRLSRHRSKDPGFADLLAYAAVVDDGVIVCKNGAFMAAWLYKAADNASSTDHERNAQAIKIAQALRGMGNGWMVHVDAVRRPAPHYSDRNVSHFPDPVSAAVDEERRRYFEALGTLYEGFFVITLTWFPPLLAQRKFIELMFDDESAPDQQKGRSAQLLDEFKRECESFENRITGAIQMERLGSQQYVEEDGTTATNDQLLQWLHYCVTGINHPIRLPENPMYIDNLIGGQEVWTGVVPRIGNKFVQVVGIMGFPLKGYMGILNSLVELPVEYRWSNRFIFMDQHEALSQLEAFRKRWRQKIRGFVDQLFNTGGPVDEDAVNMVKDAAGGIADINSGLVSQGYYTSVVVLMDEDRTKVEKAAEAIKKAIESRFFAAAVETINTMDAFMGSLPGHGVENVRRPLLHTVNLAHLIPSSTIWTGENRAPSPLYPPDAPPHVHCVSGSSTPLRLNLSVRDLGHAAIFGPTRAGKSTLLGLLALQFLRYQNARVVVFEVGMSNYPACKSVGGKHFNFGDEDDGLRLAPLARLNTRAQRAAAMEWIDTVLGLNGVVSTPDDRKRIAQTIMSMHETGSKSLSDFALTVANNRIKSVIDLYTIDHDQGQLFDSDHDEFEVDSYMCFELAKLMQMNKRYQLPALLHIFSRIEEASDGRPTLMILDEAWLMLDDPVFRQKIRAWLKTLAKKNVYVVMATQNLSDAVNSGILDVIIESTASKIFLPNHNAYEKEAMALYRRFGLNDRQIEIIAQGTLKRDYYYVSEMGRRLFQLALGPLALAFVGRTDPESVELLRSLEKQHGDQWVHEWLRINGDLKLSDYGVAA